MQEVSPIVKYANNIVPLTDEEAALFSQAFRPLRVQKRQFLVQPGFVAKNRYFVVKGALRAYVLTEDGQESTIQLAIEDWWISDYNSYMFQQPASMFVTPVEDSLLLQISYEDEQKLKATSYKFETIFRMMAEKGAAFMQRRIISRFTRSAEERYEDLLQLNPMIVNRFPQYVIASYLDMTTEFLSKIRHRKARKS